jgi:uncharacterized RDD family membrane protein YckC
VSNKSKSTTFLLCYFFGVLGIHRFYLGKFITGLLMLITAGGLCIWWLIDLYLIVTGRLKDKHGDSLRTSQPKPDQPNAGFWVRLAALTVDGLMLAVIQLVFIFAPFAAYMYNSGVLALDDPNMAMDPAALGPFYEIVLLVQGASFLVTVGYFVVLTAGKHQATYGKRSMGIYVRGRDGGRVGIGHSIVRYVGYIISWIPLGLGYLMAAFHKKKLALHDLIAGTEVAYGVPASAAESVGREAVSEAGQFDDAEPAPVPMGFSEDRTSRMPEILVGTGLLLIAGAMAFAYVR